MEMSKYYEENSFVECCYFAFGETDSSRQVDLVVGVYGGQCNPFKLRAWTRLVSVIFWIVCIYNDFFRWSVE